MPPIHKARAHHKAAAHCAENRHGRDPESVILVIYHLSGGFVIKGFVFGIKAHDHGLGPQVTNIY